MARQRRTFNPPSDLVEKGSLHAEHTKEIGAEENARIMKRRSGIQLPSEYVIQGSKVLKYTKHEGRVYCSYVGSTAKDKTLVPRLKQQGLL